MGLQRVGQRNNFTNNEEDELKRKRCSVVDVTGDRNKKSDTVKNNTA